MNEQSTPQTDCLPIEIQEYIDHITSICAAFNREAASLGIAARLDATKAIQAVTHGTEAVRAEEFHHRADDSGVIHENQIRTVVGVVAEMLAAPDRHGLILGAMQSGKTGVAMSLQFIGPMLFMMRGIKPAVFYLLGNLTSHQAQTEHELKRFLEYFGDIEVNVSGDSTTLREYQARQDVSHAFRLAPSIKTYRRSVTRGLVNDCETLELVHRRVPGRAIDRIASICRRVTDAGCLPVIVADEPQFGASDGLGRNGVPADCVMRQVLDEIDARLGGSRHVFIGLSATPFELADLETLWKVPLRLSSKYSGFNFFNGEEIDPTVATTPPTLLTLDELGTRTNAPFLENLDMGVFYGTEERFERWADRVGYLATHADYRRDCVNALRTTILDIVAGFGGAANGICIRALNNNTHSEDLIAQLNLPSNRIEVVRYFGGGSRGQSVKQLMANRLRPDLPALILVTNRARMADAFPASVTHFIELAKRASDRNALLQGLFGRACGYGKQSTVVMSRDNIYELRLFQLSMGRSSNLKPSRHSVQTRRRRPNESAVIRLNVADEAVRQDSVLRQFIDRVQTEVLDPICLGPGKEVRNSFPRQSAGRHVPLARIADELGLFEHIERNASTLFPLIEGPVSPARPDQDVAMPTASGGLGRFDTDGAGNCSIGLRWSDTDEVRGGPAGRGRGRRDGIRRHARKYTVLEPQITLEKYDPTTGETIPRSAAGRRRDGLWRVRQVALPNRFGIRQQINSGGDTTPVYPVAASPYDDRHMTKDERCVRDAI